jgi:hypothetical protein
MLTDPAAHANGADSAEREPLLTEPIRSELFQPDDELILAR